MGRLRGLLERFRPAGIPGAAYAGVPADRAAEATAELAGVFEAFTPVQAECRHIRKAAEQDAHTLRRRADEQAQALIRAVREQAEAERASASAAAVERASAERAVIIADAERLAAQFREHADEWLPAMVTRAVQMVRKARVKGGHE